MALRRKHVKFTADQGQQLKEACTRRSFPDIVAAVEDTLVTCSDAAVVARGIAEAARCVPGEVNAETVGNALGQHPGVELLGLVEVDDELGNRREPPKSRSPLPDV